VKARKEKRTDGGRRGLKEGCVGRKGIWKKGKNASIELFEGCVGRKGIWKKGKNASIELFDSRAYGRVGAGPSAGAQFIITLPFFF